MTDTALAFLRELLPDGGITLPGAKGEDLEGIHVRGIVSELIAAREVATALAEYVNHYTTHEGRCDDCKRLSDAALTALRLYAEHRKAQGEGVMFGISFGPEVTP